LGQRIASRGERGFVLARGLRDDRGGGERLGLERRIEDIIGPGREGQGQDRSDYDEATHSLLQYGSGVRFLVPIDAVYPFLLRLDYKSVILFTFLW